MLMNKPSFPTCNEITQSLGADLLATVISCIITALLSIKKTNRHGLHLKAWGPKCLGYIYIDLFRRKAKGNNKRQRERAFYKPMLINMKRLSMDFLHML